MLWKKSQIRCVDRYFQHWNDGSAYVFGFIMADGSAYEVKGNRYVKVQSTDEELLYSIRDELGDFRVAKYHWGLPHHKDLFAFNVCNQVMCGDLWELGLRPRKSKVWHLFEVPDEWFWVWLRGFTDGDGCIFKSDCGIGINWKFGTLEFANWLQEKLHRFIGTNAKPSKYTGKDTYVVQLKAKQAGTCYKHLYERSGLFLPRKKEGVSSLIGEF